MFAIVGLAAVTLFGLLVVGFFALRLLVQVRRLQEQVALTKGDLEPRYRELRSQAGHARLDAR